MAYKISGSITQNCKIRYYDPETGELLDEVIPVGLTHDLPDVNDPQGFKIYPFEADAPGSGTYDVYAKSNVDGRLWTFGDITPIYES